MTIRELANAVLDAPHGGTALLWILLLALVVLPALGKLVYWWELRGRR